jgi:tetratricopeptide (TPR) repeat protein
MHFELKALSREAVPAALEKAHRYRLLNEPEQAESICEDVLRVEPDNQAALATLVLALTDRFGGARPVPPRRVRDLLARLTSEYERAYFAGLIAEREGLSWMRSGQPRSGEAAYVCFREAMKHYERAEKVRPSANDDAILRWNSCARIIMAHPDVAPTDEIRTRTHVGD